MTHAHTQDRRPLSRPVAVPASARLLGAAGLIPFAVSVLAPWLDDLPTQEIADVTRLYGAVILSFLGGAHWGLASAAQRVPNILFALSVVPSLVAWGSLLVPGLRTSLVILVIAFISVILLDRMAVRLLAAPPWWLHLRMPLSGAVVLCLGALVAGLTVVH